MKKVLTIENNGDNKLVTIKIVKALKNMGLKEAKDLCDNLCNVPLRLIFSEDEYYTSNFASNIHLLSTNNNKFNTEDVKEPFDEETTTEIIPKETSEYNSVKECCLAEFDLDNKQFAIISRSRYYELLRAEKRSESCESRYKGFKEDIIGTLKNQVNQMNKIIADLQNHEI